MPQSLGSVNGFLLQAIPVPSVPRVTDSATRIYPPVPDGIHSPDYFAPNRGTHLRHPKHARIVIPQTRSELTGPAFPYAAIGGPDSDLTRQHDGEPIGERIILHGRVLDEDGRPLPQTLVEIWQANAAGRYAHGVDNHAAPLDPNFSGTGRSITDSEGRYRFLTIMPGRYPFQNHYNAWRPAHVHFSLLGPNFLTRLVTQMFFPGRSAAGIRSDLSGRACTRPRSCRRRVRHRCHRAGLVARFSVRSHAVGAQRRPSVSKPRRSLFPPAALGVPLLDRTKLGEHAADP